MEKKAQRRLMNVRSKESLSHWLGGLCLQAFTFEGLLLHNYQSHLFSSQSSKGMNLTIPRQQMDLP